MAKQHKHQAAALTVQPPDFLTTDEAQAFVSDLSRELDGRIAERCRASAENVLRSMASMIELALRQLDDGAQDPGQYDKFRQTSADLFKQASRLAQIAEVETTTGPAVDDKTA